MSLKVLMVGNDSSVKGGITSVISQMLSHDWKSEGIEMNFIPTYIDTNILNKILFFLFAYFRIIHCIKKWKPNVVHIHMSYKGSFSRKFIIHKLCKKYDIPDIIHLHGSEFEKWYLSKNERKQMQIKKMLREAASFIVLGNSWNNIVKRIEPKTKTIIISNTINIPKETARWEDKPFQILFLGVLIQRKGISDLLHAIQIIEETGNGGDFRLVIAGVGREEENLRKLCNQLNLNEVVTFVGWTDGQKKIDLLYNSQLLVLPSYNEGLPVAILEAISYGLPVISTNVGDISTAVVDGKNGYLILPGDIETLAIKIQKIFQSREKYERMSAYSRKLAKNKFSDVTYFKTLIMCYQQIYSLESR